MTELEQQLTARLDKAKEVFRSQKVQMDELNAKVESLSSELAKANKELTEFKTKENDNGQKFFDQVEEINILNQRLGEAELEIQKKDEQIEKHANLQSVLDKEINELLETQKALKAQIQGLVEHITTQKAVNEELNERMAVLADEKVKVEDDLRAALDLNHTLQAQLDKVTDLSKTVTEERDNMKAKIEKMQSDYKKNTTKLMGRVEEKREELEKVVTSIQNFSNGLHEDFNIFA